MSLLSNTCNVYVSTSPYTGKEIAAKHPIHGIVTRGKGDVSQSLIDLCPDLMAIARCGVGLDNINVAYAKEKKIAVINAPGSNADTVAEHTLGLMLSLQRKLFNAIDAVKKNNWAYRNSYNGDEIRGKTIGIIGMGNIGTRVAKLATAFGMKVTYCGPRQKNLDYSFLSFNQLIEQSDIISLHLPLTEKTRHLISEFTLKKMQNHALIINTSRGAIIDESALTDALKNKTIGGFAADVLITEPPKSDSPLLYIPNVLITPHAASLTARTYNYMCVFTVNKLLKKIS